MKATLKIRGAAIHSEELQDILIDLINKTYTIDVAVKALKEAQNKTSFPWLSKVMGFLGKERKLGR